MYTVTLCQDLVEGSYLASLRGGGGRLEGRAAAPPHDKLLAWVEHAYLKLKDNKVGLNSFILIK
jgi:hypothetical protein